ncbi:MAG TPA: lytic murein transglycosylase [Solirubrobacterales bacterium]
MRQKLVLTIAALSFALATAVGVGWAGADPSGAPQNPVDALTPALPAVDVPAPEVPEAPACSNQLDDDGDALTDLEDPDCTDPADDEEAAETTAPPVPAPEETGTPAPAPSGINPQPGVETGTTIDGGKIAARDKAVRNDNLGDVSGGGGTSGGVNAPPATAGDQPPATGISGGSAFGDGGSPTSANPMATIAPFGPAPIGVPNFIIDSFEIPPFLLPIYQACGTEYGIPWQVLASINKIETAFGTNLNVSTAGAMGWMQFIPSSWEMYGVDANGDGRRDPYNPVDAICAAANYLKAAGGTEDLYDAIFAYNHADWYVQEVLLYARAYGKLPTDLVASLTGLTEGAHFPIAADASYSDDISTRAALKRATPDERDDYGNAAEVITSSPTRRGINIFAAEGSPVVAVNDGVIRKYGHSKRLGNYVVLEDAYGNRYTYAELGEIVRKNRRVVMPTGQEKRVAVDSENIRPRLFANPGRGATGAQERARENVDTAASVGSHGALKPGSKVIAGTVLARVGAGEDSVDPHINFSIRPAGRGAPRIDPKPILDGWKLLEATAIYRANGDKALAVRLSGAGVLLLSKEALQRRVLADDRIELPECDRIEVRAGQIDRRLLAALAYLSEQGFRLTITSMLCGRYGSITTSGNVSNHSFGNAADIAQINGIPVLGHQGPGSITEELLRSVLRLQGTLTPDELISLQELGGPSFAMSDHADHVHIGYSPVGGTGDTRFVQLLKPNQWQRLVGRLGEIENPEVATEPSDAALPDKGSPAAKKKSGGTSSGD